MTRKMISLNLFIFPLTDAHWNICYDENILNIFKKMIKIMNKSINIG